MKGLHDNGGNRFDGRNSVVMDTAAGLNLRNLLGIKDSRQASDEDVFRNGVLADLGGRVPKHSLPCLRVPLASAAACSIVCSRISPTDDVNLSPEMVRANWTSFYTTYGGPLFGRGGQVRYVKANATA